MDDGEEFLTNEQFEDLLDECYGVHEEPGEASIDCSSSNSASGEVSPCVPDSREEQFSVEITGLAATTSTIGVVEPPAALSQLTGESSTTPISSLSPNGAVSANHEESWDELSKLLNDGDASFQVGGGKALENASIAIPSSITETNHRHEISTPPSFTGAIDAPGSAGSSSAAELLFESFVAGVTSESMDLPAEPSSITNCAGMEEISQPFGAASTVSPIADFDFATAISKSSPAPDATFDHLSGSSIWQGGAGATGRSYNSSTSANTPSLQAEAPLWNQQTMTSNFVRQTSSFGDDPFNVSFGGNGMSSDGRDAMAMQNIGFDHQGIHVPQPFHPNQGHHTSFTPSTGYQGNGQQAMACDTTAMPPHNFPAARNFGLATSSTPKPSATTSAAGSANVSTFHVPATSKQANQGYATGMSTVHQNHIPVPHPAPFVPRALTDGEVAYLMKLQAHKSSLNTAHSMGQQPFQSLPTTTSMPTATPMMPPHTVHRQASITPPRQGFNQAGCHHPMQQQYLHTMQQQNLGQPVPQNISHPQSFGPPTPPSSGRKPTLQAAQHRAQPPPPFPAISTLALPQPGQKLNSAALARQMMNAQTPVKQPRGKAATGKAAKAKMSRPVTPAAIKIPSPGKVINHSSISSPGPRVQKRQKTTTSTTSNGNSNSSKSDTPTPGNHGQYPSSFRALAMMKVQQIYQQREASDDASQANPMVHGSNQGLQSPDIKSPQTNGLPSGPPHHDANGARGPMLPQCAPDTSGATRPVASAGSRRMTHQVDIAVLVSAMKQAAATGQIPALIAAMERAVERAERASALALSATTTSTPPSGQPGKHPASTTGTEVSAAKVQQIIKLVAAADHSDQTMEGEKTDTPEKVEKRVDRAGKTIGKETRKVDKKERQMKRLETKKQKELMRGGAVAKEAESLSQMPLPSWGSAVILDDNQDAHDEIMERLNSISEQPTASPEEYFTAPPFIEGPF